MARNTGRVLVLQRAFGSQDDPAAGTYEFPGGTSEDGETALQTAKREWSEEVGQEVPRGSLKGSWTAGKYRGFVWSIPSETQVTINAPHSDREVKNPDGDEVETVAWWEPDQLLKNPIVRPELRRSMRQVQAALSEAKTAGMVSSFIRQTFRPGVAELKRRLSGVTVSSDIVNLRPTARGVYSTAKRQVTVRPDMNLADRARTRRHEFGHAVQFNSPANTLAGGIGQMALQSPADSWRRATGLYLAEMQARAMESRSLGGQVYNAAKYMLNPIAAKRYATNPTYGWRYGVIHGATALPTVAAQTAVKGSPYVLGAAVGQQLINRQSNSKAAGWNPFTNMANDALSNQSEGVTTGPGALAGDMASAYLRPANGALTALNEIGSYVPGWGYVAGPVAGVGRYINKSIPQMAQRSFNGIDKATGGYLGRAEQSVRGGLQSVNKSLRQGMRSKNWFMSTAAGFGHNLLNTYIAPNTLRAPHVQPNGSTGAAQPKPVAPVKPVMPAASAPKPPQVPKPPNPTTPTFFSNPVNSQYSGKAQTANRAADSRYYLR